MNCFQMLSVHEKSCELILVLVQTKEYTKTNVVDSAFHSSVHSLGVVSVVVLRASRVENLIAFLVVSFLEKDISTDSGIVKLAVVFNSCSGNVDIYTSDSAVLMLDRVDSLDTFQNVLDRVIYRVFAAFDSKALMTHILKCDNFLADLLLSQLLSGDLLVLQVVGAVNALVNAVV